MPKQFEQVSCTYGAPMGRACYGQVEDLKAKSVSLFKVRFGNDCYDDGGAYWGWPANLYCARTRNDDNYQQFIRASNRKEAAEKLELTSDYLTKGF